MWTLVRAGRLDVYQADEVIAGELVAVQDRSLVPGILDDLLAELEATTPCDATRGDGIGLLGVNPTATRRIIRRLVAAAQPDVTQKRFQRGYAQRRVHTGPGSVQGMGELWLSHSIDRITGISHRLGLLARALPADDPRSIDQRIADLAAGILEGRIVADTPTSLLEEGAAPALRRGAVRRRIQMNVTVPIQTLMGISETPGETLTGEVVPAGLVRQLAADPDSVWYRMLTDAGRFVELSTDAYKPAAALGRNVVVRDRTCAGVGCSHPADTADLDHSRAHANGGPTSESNLGPACRGHHRLKDGGGFVLTQTEPGTFRWTYPSGHTYTRQPGSHPVTTWPVTVPCIDDRNTESAKTVPASAADIREGLDLLHAKRQREAQAELVRRRAAVVEQRHRFWRSWYADDDRPPADDAVDCLGSLTPTERVEALELIA